MDRRIDRCIYSSFELHSYINLTLHLITEYVCVYVCIYIYMHINAYAMYFFSNIFILVLGQSSIHSLLLGRSPRTDQPTKICSRPGCSSASGTAQNSKCAGHEIQGVGLMSRYGNFSSPKTTGMLDVSSPTEMGFGDVKQIPQIQGHQSQPVKSPSSQKKRGDVKSGDLCHPLVKHARNNGETDLKSLVKMHRMPFREMAWRPYH